MKPQIIKIDNNFEVLKLNDRIWFAYVRYEICEKSVINLITFRKHGIFGINKIEDFEILSRFSDSITYQDIRRVSKMYEMTILPLADILQNKENLELFIEFLKYSPFLFL